MCCKVFVFYDLKKDFHVYLNGPDSADPDKLLQLYVDWYNNDFLDLDSGDPIDFNDFKYLECNYPIDFYDDYLKKCDNSFIDRINQFIAEG